MISEDVRELKEARGLLRKDSVLRCVAANE